MIDESDKLWPRKRPALFRGLSQQQLDTLGQIATGHDTGTHPKRAAMLEARGLIISVLNTRTGHSWPGWEMEAAVHVAWCAWCSEIAGEDGSDE